MRVFWALGSEGTCERPGDCRVCRRCITSHRRRLVLVVVVPRRRRVVVASSSPRRRLYLHPLPELAVARRGRRVSSSPHCFGRCRNVVASSSPRPVPIVASSSQPHRRRRRQPVRHLPCAPVTAVSRSRAAPPVTTRRPNQHEHAWARLLPDNRTGGRAGESRFRLSVLCWGGSSENRVRI